MIKHIPLFNLQRQHTKLKKEIFKELEKVYDNCEFTYGAATPLFEKNFATLSHTKYSLAVRSGTASLVVALKALELKPGDEVLTTPVSFSASSDAIVLAGGIPVFVDVDPQTGNIDPEKLKTVLKKRAKKVRAILIVHLYGIPCQLDEISTLCQTYHIPLIEDASHAHGSLYNKQPVGSFGLAGCFSLYPSKTLGSIGNAGVITTSDKLYYQKIRMYGNHGIKDPKDKYTHYVNGYNELIDNLQAAVLNIKLAYIQSWIKRKSEIATYYTRALAEVGVKGMYIPKYAKPSLYLYAFQVTQRKKLQHFLKKKNIDTGVYYPHPLHLQPNFEFLKYKKGDLPHAELFSQQTLALPLYPELTNAEVEYIGDSLTQFFS